MADKILKLCNVVGYGTGKKNKKGRKCIQVFVTKKLPEKKLNDKDIVPKKINGKLTDVIEIGEVVAQIDNKKLHRPIPIGVSGGHIHTTAGTIGPIVFRESIFVGEKELGFFGRTKEWMKTHFPSIFSKKLYWLTNAHVGAINGNEKIGDPFVQPGTADGGLEQVGTLQKIIPIRDFVTIDACLIRPINDVLLKNEILGLGKVTGNIKPKIGMKVKKSGRTTGVTTGQITAIGVTIGVKYEKLGTIFIKDCFIMSHMSKGGDSGSLVVDENNKAVGLIFAGSDKASFGCSIENIMKELDCSLYLS